TDREIHHFLRALWISRIARGLLCADRLRELLLEGAPSRRLSGLAVERLADGLLPSGDARQGRAAARRRCFPDRRSPVRMEMPLGKKQRAAGTSLRPGFARGHGKENRRGARQGDFWGLERSRAPLLPAPRRAHAARARRRIGLLEPHATRRAL